MIFYLLNFLRKVLDSLKRIYPNQIIIYTNPLQIQPENNEGQWRYLRVNSINQS